MLTRRISHLLILIAIFSTSAAQLCANLNCCTATEKELEACRGIHGKCPGYYTRTGVESTSCDVCAPGLCRVGATCMCPDKFLIGFGAVTFQRECAVSHSQNWPLSVGKEDLERRKCAKPPIKMPSYCTNMSCCEATEEKLQACRGFHSKCPGHINTKGVDITSCND
eukprot:IDg14481t1